jgi:hypothetical protein
MDAPRRPCFDDSHKVTTVSELSDRASALQERLNQLKDSL